MFHKNRLLEALSHDDEMDLSRRELKEVLSELSTSKRRVQKNLDTTVVSQIFKFLIGLVILIAILFSMFILGSRYLFQENVGFELTNRLSTKNLQKKFDNVSSFFFKSKNNVSKKPFTTSLTNTPTAALDQDYYVQVALCQYAKCSNFFKEKLNNSGYAHKVVQLKKGESTPYKEIISVQAMSLQKAQNLSEFINTINDRSGYANVVSVNNGLFKVSLGIFPNPALAEDLRRYYESLAASDLVQFTYSESLILTETGLSKILAGPFTTVEKATQAFQTIRAGKNLETSFITVY